MYSKKNGRVTFRSNRRQNYRRSNNYNSGKIRNKGNIAQQYQKYLKLAKEAFSSGDRIQSEYFFQFADHYSRLMIDLGISIDDNTINQTSTEDRLVYQKDVNDTNSNVSGETSENLKKEVENTQDEDNDHESIDSISFISEPVKKKAVKSKKVSS